MAGTIKTTSSISQGVIWAEVVGCAPSDCAGGLDVRRGALSARSERRWLAVARVWAVAELGRHSAAVPLLPIVLCRLLRRAAGDRRRGCDHGVVRRIRGGDGGDRSSGGGGVGVAGDRLRRTRKWSQHRQPVRAATPLPHTNTQRAVVTRGPIDVSDAVAAVGPWAVGCRTWTATAQVRQRPFRAHDTEARRGGGVGAGLPCCSCHRCAAGRLSWRRRWPPGGGGGQTRRIRRVRLDGAGRAVQGGVGRPGAVLHGSLPPPASVAVLVPRLRRPGLSTRVQAHTPGSCGSSTD